jgi:hypothetical protein
MDQQITLGSATDLNPIRGEAELSGDAHGLAVAVHKDPTRENVHHR